MVLSQIYEFVLGVDASLQLFPVGRDPARSLWCSGVPYQAEKGCARNIDF